MDSYLWTLIIIMLISGVFGGIINYLIEIRGSTSDVNIFRSLAAGLGASFLVPLFLNMISSGLIVDIKNSTESTNDKVLVFAGFCLIASISSTAFIRTISDRILLEAKTAKQEALNASEKIIAVKQEVDNILKDLKPFVESSIEGDGATEQSLPPELSDDNIRKVWDSFQNSKYRLRSINGISRDTNISKENVIEILNTLKEHAIVGEEERKGGLRWRLT